MDTARLKTFVNGMWDDSVVPTITDYIAIPNKSPAFDPEWEAHGHMDKAVALFEAWAKEKIAALPGATIEVVRLPKRTPVIYIDIPGDKDDTILMYGHLDKQPEMTGWFEGFGPWQPKRDGDKLYGRGSADDGYAMFGALTALLALADQKVKRARCVVLIEACEESGSYDLPHYIDHLADRLGKPSLVICLDSGCGNYDQLWLTTSLRGIAMGVLTVRVLTEGVHSGDASGLVPSSFRILRSLISRVEDEATGEIKLQELYTQVPPQRIEQAKAAAKVLGDAVYSKMPFAGGTKPMNDDLTQLVLNRTWRPALAVTGWDGYPQPQNAGNVLLPFSSAKLSFRLPPQVDAAKATAAIKKTFEENAPYGAVVEFDAEEGQGGWNAPQLSPWLEKSVEKASEIAFGKPAAYMGEGGTIPFMGMLGEKFPETQFVITGVLGPQSNAHGPNEFLHIPTGKAVTVAIAQIVSDHFERT
ncbi:MAG TPA: M20/M25/M40 family metallo-hydrolase [Rhizomicrobium sp.]|jgi:acetylornithine deacetylase/succinyl-diaminopimelate desuccinylase-like protein|nr:M20/M25/M40 family metallo-hydrolase [Rhizomicrobium sp.]